MRNLLFSELLLFLHKLPDNNVARFEVVLVRGAGFVDVVYPVLPALARGTRREYSIDGLDSCTLFIGREGNIFCRCDKLE